MAPGGEVFSRLVHALGVVRIDAVNADAGITHIDKHLGRSRFLFTDSSSSVRKVFTSTIIQVLDGS